MLYTFNKLATHKSYRLNRNLLYFFSKIRHVDHLSIFNVEDYFDNDFAHFVNLQNQTTLKEHFTNFFEIFKGLQPPQKLLIINSFKNSQNIDSIILDQTFDAKSIALNSLPASIRAQTKSLFEYLYKRTLVSFGKLTDHYKLIFDSLSTNICPFCGIEFLNDPSITRQDYDHMLMVSTYTFCGVNMDNLVPTGVECNRINKHSVDILFDKNVRTIFNSAYSTSVDIQISLEGSTPPTRANQSDNWVITISPHNPLTVSWARVYNIQDRYKKNVLKKFYSAWLKELRECLFMSNKLPISEQNLLNELSASASALKANPTLSLGNIVKGAVYEYVATNNTPGFRNGVVNYVNSKRL